MEKRFDVRLRAGEDYASTDVQCARLASEFIGLPIGADDQQKRSASNQRPRFDEEAQALARKAVADERDHPRTGRDYEFLAYGSALGCVGSGSKAFKIDAVVDRHNFLGREAEFTNQIVANKIRHRDRAL